MTVTMPDEAVMVALLARTSMVFSPSTRDTVLDPLSAAICAELPFRMNWAEVAPPAIV